MKGMSRRDILRTAGAGGLLLSAAGISLLPLVFREKARGSLTLAQDPFDPRQPTDFTNPLFVSSDQGLFGFFQPSSNFTMTAKIVDQDILPNTSGRLWVYEVEQAGKQYHNPILRLRTGSDFHTVFQNGLSEVSIIHWHGFRVDTQNDGHPTDVIPAGATYPYSFTVRNRAGTYWYHPHPHGNTARQVYFGLASLLIVEDEEEDRLQSALDLNLGETDIPLILQDKRFNSDGTILYNPNRSEFLVPSRKSRGEAHAPPPICERQVRSPALWPHATPTSIGNSLPAGAPDADPGSYGRRRSSGGSHHRFLEDESPRPSRTSPSLHATSHRPQIPPPASPC